MDEGLVLLLFLAPDIAPDAASWLQALHAAGHLPGVRSVQLDMGGQSADGHGKCDLHWQSGILTGMLTRCPMNECCHVCVACDGRFVGAWGLCLMHACVLIRSNSSNTTHASFPSHPFPPRDASLPHTQQSAFAVCTVAPPQTRPLCPPLGAALWQPCSSPLLLVTSTIKTRAAIVAAAASLASGSCGRLWGQGRFIPDMIWRRQCHRQPPADATGEVSASVAPHSTSSAQ